MLLNQKLSQFKEAPVAKSSNVSNNNLFELDPSDPNPILFAMAEETQSDNNSRTTESGLIIADIVNGEGDEASAGQTVTVNYTGTLEDGHNLIPVSAELHSAFPWVLDE